MPDVLGYLQGKNLRIKRAGGHEVNVPCFFHGESEGERGRLYVNVDPNADIPGLFHCKVCEEKGSFVSIQKHFGDYEKPLREDDSHARHEIFNFAADHYHRMLGENDAAFSWLRGPERGFTLETIIEAKLGYADGTLWRALREANFSSKDIMASGLFVDGERPVESLKGMVTIPYFVAGNCVQIRGRSYPLEEGRPKYKTTAGAKARLFNTDVVWGAEELVAAEGEFDALMLKQLGFNAVGLPGVTSWQDTWKGYFEGCRRIWITFDGDGPGREGAAKLKERVGPKSRIVTLPENVDVTGFVQQGNTAHELRRLMETSKRTGVLLTVDDAIKEHAGVQGLSGVKLGYEGLDALIEPGLLPGQVAVVLAKTSTGKTIFCLNLMERMVSRCPGQEDMKLLFVSLEQTRGEWWERAKRIHQFHNLHASDSETRDFWRNRLMLVDKNRLTEAELSTAMDDFEEEMGGPPDLVVVDYLGYWAQGFAGERYQRTSDAVMALKAIAKDRRVPIVTPHQVSRGSKQGDEPDIDSARDAGVVDETADFIFTLWSGDNQLGKAQEERTGCVYMRVAKSRHGGRGQKLRFQFAPISLAMVPHADPESVLARREVDWDRHRMPFEEALGRHRRGVT